MLKKIGYVVIGINSIFLSLTRAATTFLFANMIDNHEKFRFSYLTIAVIVSTMLVPINHFIIDLCCSKSKKIYKYKLLSVVSQKKLIFLESDEYNDKVNTIRNNDEQERKLYLGISTVFMAIGYFLSFMILLKIYLPWFWLAVNVLFLIALMLAEFKLNYKKALLMSDFWEKYIGNMRYCNYISDVLTQKQYVEEKKIYHYSKYFEIVFDKEFTDAAERNRGLGKNRIIIELWNHITFELFSVIQLGLLLWYYYSRMISIEYLVVFIPFALTAFSSFCASFSAISDIVQVKSFYKDVVSFSEYENDENEPIMINNDEKYAIRLNSVQFAYPHQDKKILDGISFDFKKGKKYAIVGVNGSGKTTLAKIISGCYHPQQGKVWRSSEPAVLFQDFNRYPFTVSENIALSNKYIDERITDTIAQVGMGKEIMGFQNGIRTPLTNLKDGGVNLSGGQWQRIALARILYLPNDIIILDEPTASLDPLTEIEIYKEYMKLLKEKTVIYITHRLGYVKEVDEIVVLNEGKIAEHGSPAELLENTQGLFYRMFEEQKNLYEN